MAFLYDIFYEVISEEGVWVLILIASALAVASFILLALRMETNPKQGTMSQKNTKSRKELKGEKNKDGNKTTPEPNADLPPGPGMKPPGDFAHPEVVLPGSAPYKNIPQPVDGQSSGSVAKPKPRPAFDPSEVAPMSSTEPEHTPSIDQNPISAAGAETEQAATVASVGIAGMPEGEELIMPKKSKQPDEESEEKSEGKPEGNDIFNLFEEVENEEETQLTEFAKNLDDIALTNLLTDTEDLSQELKGMLTQHKRRQQS